MGKAEGGGEAEIAVYPGVNNTRCRRALTLSLLALRGRLSRKYAGVWVSRYFVIKRGCLTSRAEVEAMQLVSRHTSIPVPRIYCAFERRRDDGHGKKEPWVFIMMERMPGEILLLAWSKMTEAEKASVISQLRGFFDELRALRPPRPGAVGSALTYSAVTDVRWSDCKYGPYQNLDEFHDMCGTTYCLKNDCEGLVSENPTLPAEEESRKLNRTTCFTHGDLNSFNFLYKDGKITAILDWGCSGWLPEYWEYTASWHTIMYDEHWWKDELSKFLDNYPHELKLERARRAVMV